MQLSEALSTLYDSHAGGLEGTGTGGREAGQLTGM